MAKTQGAGNIHNKIQTNKAALSKIVKLIASLLLSRTKEVQEE
jgi:hypothetical protein